MANGSGKITAVQSGVLPIAGDMVVLITTRSSGRWIIPKGYVEKGMTPHESAAKEAWEEAGIVGKVEPEPIGTYSYRRPSGMFAVKVYPLEVESLLERWEEMHVRERRVVTPAEAIDMVCNKELAQILSSFFHLSL
ncbi:NUDIX hydrolase [Chlorobaculum parvum NCIB 8327]|uniref:NUDIX hydrolase n=1 Tax=Chlorobaculum parvum (strain DSM 263 / NCIMB 8327) TaxID=517417 RepID=B3QMG0_CHLP8|nr:NUDIX hydrolase [Chlorobaculum parvum]ACF11113.1 NUDIX hydrolase [Chlorobaculum parvum NCIB 8327]